MQEKNLLPVKLKDMFSKEKKVENLISLLIILVITLLIINKILTSDEETVKRDYENETGVVLASTNEDNKYDLEKRLEKILNKISGISNVSVLLTYDESSSLVPVYNINSSITGSSNESKTESIQKDVVLDHEQNVVTEKVVNPTIKGVIVTALGVSNPVLKSNVIQAVEAVTGCASHKIQVFETGEN